MGGALEVVSYLLIWPGIAVLGRRVCLVASFLIAAVSLGGVVALQSNGHGG